MTSSMASQWPPTFKTKVQLLHHTYLWPWTRRAMDKEKIKAMVTKFSEKFAIIALKKHRKFCRRGLTYLDATSTFKNRPNTYETPCGFDNYSFARNIFLNSSKKFMQIPLKVNKVYFLTSSLASQWPFENFLQKVKITPYLCMDSNILIKKGHGQRKNLSYVNQIFRKVCHNYA